MCASIMLSPCTRSANTSSPPFGSAEGASGSSPSRFSSASNGVPAATRPSTGTGRKPAAAPGSVNVSAREVRPTL